MKIKEIVDPKIKFNESRKAVIGIDIGSRTAKAVLIKDGDMFSAKVGTGFNMQDTADELIVELLKQSNISLDDIDYIVGTGYGRVALKFDGIPNHMLSEITCHAMGVHYLDADAKTVIDIGGQDSKAIRIDPFTGKVVRFVMNDKCAAGTGRFLEKVAAILGYQTEEIGDAAMKSQKEIDVNSQCVVFAESEIVSLRAAGEDAEDILSGVHMATAKRVYALVKRVELEPGLQFSGGVSNNVGMKHAIEVLTGTTIKATKLDMTFAGCLGAAIYARRYANNEEHIESDFSKHISLNLNNLKEAVKKEKDLYIEKKGSEKQVGYLCSYTPVELMQAAGVKHFRLFMTGSAEEVALGEIMTQSTTCDMVKSCVGLFSNNNKLYHSVDQVYTFHTCVSMKKAAEEISAHYKKTEIFHLPRQRKSDIDREEYRTEIRSFKESLETLTGRKITDNDLRAQIAEYNLVKQKIRRISDFRKQENPPISGSEFFEISKAYYYLPPKKLIPILDDIYHRLEKAPKKQGRPIRLMICGGIEGDGDNRVVEIIEKELGAKVVVEDHCTGLSPFYNDIPEDGDPIKNISDSYFDKVPCSIMSPIEDRIDFAEKLSKEYCVDGVIYTYLKFCACCGIPKNLFTTRFRNNGIPVLELAVDYSKNDDGQLKTRIEAFIEVLAELIASRKEVK